MREINVSVIINKNSQIKFHFSCFSRARYLVKYYWRAAGLPVIFKVALYEITLAMLPEGLLR